MDGLQRAPEQGTGPGPACKTACAEFASKLAPTGYPSVIHTLPPGMPRPSAPSQRGFPAIRTLPPEVPGDPYTSTLHIASFRILFYCRSDLLGRHRPTIGPVNNKQSWPGATGVPARARNAGEES